MPRGQYDRAAARAKHDGSWEEFLTPLPNGSPETILDLHQQPVTQAAYDALVTQRDRLLRLCQTHGLMVG